MRLWSLHPSLLDRAGLIALWREGLLAQKVLQGNTKGYTQHPQLARFKACSDPVCTIGAYLSAVLAESQVRGYRFDADKIVHPGRTALIPVTQGQLEYEFEHLKRKLKSRDPDKYRALLQASPTPHPMMTVVPGPVASWEVV